MGCMLVHLYHLIACHITHTKTSVFYPTKCFLIFWPAKRRLCCTTSPLSHDKKNSHCLSLSTVSNLALNEYENLHEKFEVEQSCRTKAEEFATTVSKLLMKIMFQQLIYWLLFFLKFDWSWLWYNLPDIHVGESMVRVVNFLSLCVG